LYITYKNYLKLSKILLKLIIVFIAAIQDQRIIFLKLLRQLKPLKVAIFQYRAVLLFLACRCYDSRVAAAAAAATVQKLLI